jgi:hypothetical protein
MGTLRSASDCSGLLVNGITLGEPTFTDEMHTLTLTRCCSRGMTRAFLLA